MKSLILIILCCATAVVASAQTMARVKLINDEIIKGEWLGMEDRNYLIGLDNEAIYYVPREMVYKLKLKRSYTEFPKYDQNRNTFFFSAAGLFNTTIGQENENFNGAGLNLSFGYDWDHRYDVMINTGINNMNIGNQEIFVPTTVTVRKYLTSGRYLVFAGIEAGYQWGITNQWTKSTNTVIWQPAGWNIWQRSDHNRGAGPLLTPLAGIRMIGKNGIDHVFRIGLHFQRFYSENKLEDADFSSVEIDYKRWQISYGMIF